MKYIKKIFESNETSLDQIKDIFQDLSDITYVNITEEYFAENYDESPYHVLKVTHCPAGRCFIPMSAAIEIGDGNQIERIGYSIRIKDQIQLSGFRLISDIFDCLDKSIKMIKSIDPTMEVYIRKTESIIPDIYLLKEENREEIIKHQITLDVDYVVNIVNSTPSHKKISKNIFTNINVSKNKTEISFQNELEEEFVKSFKFMWMEEVNSDCEISSLNNKILIRFKEDLY